MVRGVLLRLFGNLAPLRTGMAEALQDVMTHHTKLGSWRRWCFKAQDVRVEPLTEAQVHGLRGAMAVVQRVALASSYARSR